MTSMWSYITRYFFLIFFLGNCLLLCACHSNSKDNAVMTVSLQEPDAPLNYSGQIEPLAIINVMSPTEGTITKQNFYFGDSVKKDALLLNLSSTKYTTDYQNALISYLKAKDEYNTAKQKFNGTEDLWKNGLIARNDYDAQKAALANSYAMMLQQQAAFRKYLPPGTNIDESLTLENQEALRKILNSSDSSLSIYAPASGIVMTPLKADSSDNNSQSNTDSLAVGTLVKEDQAVLAIADLSGLKIHVNVNQMDVNKLQNGLPVTVASDAFSEQLNGLIDSVSIQAKSINNQSNAQPTFPVTIVIPQINLATMKDIRIGMTAKVQIHLSKTPVILIPLSAVHHTANVDQVIRIDAHGHKVITPVKINKTVMNNVIVDSGLKAGDQILVTYPAP